MITNGENYLYSDEGPLEDTVDMSQRDFQKINFYNHLEKIQKRPIPYVQTGVVYEVPCTYKNRE